MPRRSWEVRIADIAEAIETVLGYISGMTFEQFVSDRKTVDAVIRNLIVIGEAASHVPENVVAMHPGLPWREMRDMRNIAVHEYFGVDNSASPAPAEAGNRTLAVVSAICPATAKTVSVHRIIEH